MILLLDIGNTRIKWVLFADGRSSVKSAAAYHEQELDTVFAKLWHVIPRPERVVAACVAGDVVRSHLSAWCMQQWGLVPEYIVSVAEQCGVRNAYVFPEQLGADRWLAMIGARQISHLAGQALCVIGCGTALTVDILTAEGQHLGGWIAPGIGLMRRGLEVGTAVFAAGIAPVTGSGNFAIGSMEAAATGTMQAAVGLIMQALRMANDQYDLALVCVLTGGDAESLLPLLPQPAHYVPDLIFLGLAQLVTTDSEQVNT
ncbi:MAG: type III pantothenate kinase [Thiohalomonadaceae bacterium]